MPDPAASIAPSRRTAAPARRTVLLLGASAAVGGVLSGCGPIRLGQPAPYTPPPEGIDDLYRADLLAALADIETATGTIRAPHPEAAMLLGELAIAVVEQRAALLTGAETEASESASDGGGATASSGTATSSGDASPTGDAGATGAASDGGGSPAAAPSDAPGLLQALGDLVLLCAEACVQCSGSFARVVAAIGTHLTWSAARLAPALADPAATAAAPPAEDAIAPTRRIPASDPPSVAAKTDYEAMLQQAQGDEWYAGYVQEVRAARTVDETARAAALDAVTTHRDRAERLRDIAEADGIAPVAEEPVYALPGGGLDQAALDAEPLAIAQGLAVDWVALTGAVPFERRAFAVATALAEAHGLAALGGVLPALPSLDPQSD